MKWILAGGFLLFIYALVWALCKAAKTEYPDIEGTTAWKYQETGDNTHNKKIECDFISGNYHIIECWEDRATHKPVYYIGEDIKREEKYKTILPPNRVVVPPIEHNNVQQGKDIEQKT